MPTHSDHKHPEAELNVAHPQSVTAALRLSDYNVEPLPARQDCIRVSLSGVEALMPTWVWAEFKRGADAADPGCVHSGIANQRLDATDGQRASSLEKRQTSIRA